MKSLTEAQLRELMLEAYRAGVNDREIGDVQADGEELLFEPGVEKSLENSIQRLIDEV